VHAVIGAPMRHAGPSLGDYRPMLLISVMRVSSPLFPASQTIGLAPGTERYGTSPARDGAEKNGRRHGSSALRCAAQVEQRAEQTWTGARSLARKRIDGSQACPRVGIVLQRSVVEIAAQRSSKAAHSGNGADVVLRVGGSYTSR
jgi:hypothetical protein